MTAIAVASVIVALVAALAYAGPKVYWYRLQGDLMREQAEADRLRFVALKESHDKGEILPHQGPFSGEPPTSAIPGQYL